LQHIRVVLDDENLLLAHCAESSLTLSARKRQIVSGDLT
jgi:hypothetical protein